MRTLAIVLMLIGGTISLHAQSGCCATSSVASFAAFAEDPTFRDAHPEPLPYTHQSDGKMVSVPVPGSTTATAYRVDSREPSTHYVLVFHEWWGLNDYIKNEADRIAASLNHNVTVIAVDLFDGKVATTRDQAAEYMQASTEARSRAIIDAVIASCGPIARIATVGWCFGGGWSMQASLAAADKAAACVIYYGMPEFDVDKLRRLPAPVLGIFAARDKSISPAVVERFEKAMKEAGRSLEVRTYDADHAFANPSNPKHRVDDTKDAYERTIAFLRKNLH